MKYLVSTTERRHYMYEVVADSVQDAIDKVEDGHGDEISSDFIDMKDVSPDHVEVIGE